MQYLLGIAMFLTALFWILLVLIQRGRGGGLAGAFGGAGGQSAFGTKAGDMFTKITIGTAAVWIIIAASSVRLLNAPKMSVLGDGGSGPSVLTSGPSDDSDGEEGLIGGGLEGTEGAGTEGGATEGTEATGPDASTGAEAGTEPATSTTTVPGAGTAVPAADPPATTPDVDPTLGE